MPSKSKVAPASPNTIPNASPQVRLLTPRPDAEIAASTNNNESFRAPAVIHEAISSLSEAEDVTRGELITWQFLAILDLQNTALTDAQILERVRNLRAAPHTGAIRAWVDEWRPNRRARYSGKPRQGAQSAQEPRS